MNPVNQPQEEEDTDYDPFASWRPGGISVDDNPQDAADAEDLDTFESYRPKEEEISKIKSEKNKPKKTATFDESAKDYAKQFGKNTLIGLGGTWGDLAELAGVRENQLPGEKSRFSAESEILDKMEQPGYKPSFSDINFISGDEDLTPGSFRLPTSKNLNELNDILGGPGEPKTPAGKYGKRQGTLYGSGVAFGQVNPVPALLAGGAGQAVEDLGGGPLAQGAAEIVTLLATQGKGASKTLVGSAKEEVAQRINDMRRLGYTERDITLAINSASKGKKGGIKASKGSRTEQAFEDFAEHSDQMVSNILTAEIPGIERGIGNVHQLASEAYGQVAREASNLVIKDSSPFINSATNVVRDIRRNLGRNPEGETFLNRLHDAVVASTQNPTAENFMNFYKELNKAGNWMGRSQKDRLLTQVKNGIKDTFRHEGPEGRRIAQRFEDANMGIRRAYQAEEVHNLVQKTATQNGIDYKKLNKLFDSTENVHLMEDVLGVRQTQNLHNIAREGQAVKDFDKAWKVTNIFQGNNALDIARGTGAAYYLYKGDMKGLAGVLASKGTGVAARKISEKLLTDPKLQNLMIRGLHAIRNESPRSFKSANEAMQKYLDDQNIDLKLD